MIGNPLETTVALHYLIFDGVLERHPNLKILAVHGGGYLGAYSGRIDHAWGARSDAHGSLPKPPTALPEEEVYFDTVVFTPIQLEALVKTFGADHVVLGTDYPFDMADFDPIEHVVSTGFDAATTAAICGGNAKRILGSRLRGNRPARFPRSPPARCCSARRGRAPPRSASPADMRRDGARAR